MDTANKKRFSHVLLLGVVASAGVWLIRRREPSLLDHARRIPNMQAVALSPDPYFWLNDNELMYQKPMPKAGAFQVMRRNIETGAETVQGDLPSGGLQLSPNGAWALTYKSARDGSLFTIERTDGSRKFLYRSPAKSLPILAWTPDDFCLVELLPPYTEKGKAKPGLLRTYFLNSATPIASNTVEENSTALTLLGALPNHHVLATDHYMWLTTNERSVNAGKVQMLDFPPERDSAAHHYVISKPSGSMDMEASLSPQGTRIAWMFGNSHEPPGFDRFFKLYTMLHIRRSLAASIWISNPDGSGLHEIGSVPIIEAPKNTTNITCPTDMRWTPNGKNLSFLYKNSLYIVPVP